MLLGPLSCKILMLAFGYLWPAYQSYKAVAMSKAKLIEYWCMYWLILGIFLAVEWVADASIFWVPLYHEAKILFILFLWHPRTQGASIVFSKAVQPMLARHEANIDRTIEETKAKVTDNVTRHFVRAKELAAGNATTVLESLRSFSEGSRTPSLTRELHHEKSM